MTGSTLRVTVPGDATLWVVCAFAPDIFTAIVVSSTLLFVDGIANAILLIIKINNFFPIEFDNKESNTVRITLCPKKTILILRKAPSYL